jgi:CspA family cold shock protein
MAVREHGTVKFFDATKGYGFIKADNGPDVFLSAKSVPSGAKVEKNTRVSFIRIQEAKGPRAGDLEVFT